MRMVVQNFKTGKLSLAHVPEPRVRSGGVLVRSRASLISIGTDRAVIALARKGPLGKARDRPDLARQVINKARTDGVWATYKVVKNLLAEPIPLGYSVVGDVIAVGADVQGVKPGDRVACAGLGYANHAETIYVPKNLFVPVPQSVDDENAAYVTLGAIAMHGVRQANQQLGANVLIVGLGLVGQITAQICRAAGYHVIGLDFDARKCELAKQCGTHLAFLPDAADLDKIVATATDGYGVDAALITAASKDSGDVFDRVATLCRDRARVVVVGEAKMDMTRRDYFNKELEIYQSRSYGPGRYDPEYEENGRDYPIGYVRWTERRNMEFFLGLIADSRIDLQPLTTHRFPFADAEKAYEMVTGNDGQLIVGVLLTYDNSGVEDPPVAAARLSVPAKGLAKTGKISLGIFGAGRFARGILIPAIMGTGKFSIAGVVSASGLSAQTVADRYGADYATSDGLAMLDDVNVDAVVIATRPDTHAQFVVAALERGKHVFVEKPLCLTQDELERVAEASRASAGTLTVGFNRRHSPLVVRMRDHFSGRVEPMAMMYRVNAGRIPRSAKEAWVHDASTGGGRIVSEICHFVDTMQFLCQARPVSVTAAAIDPRQSTLVSNDIVTLTVGFDDGSLGTVHYWSNGNARYPKERMEVFCQERIAVLDNFRRLELVSGNRVRVSRALNQKKGFDEEARAFAEVCRTGEPVVPLESLIDTTRVTLLATAALQGSFDEDCPGED